MTQVEHRTSIIMLKACAMSQRRSLGNSAQTMMYWINYRRLGQEFVLKLYEQALVYWWAGPWILIPNTGGCFMFYGQNPTNFLSIKQFQLLVYVFFTVVWRAVFKTKLFISVQYFFQLWAKEQFLSGSCHSKRSVSQGSDNYFLFVS